MNFKNGIELENKKDIISQCNSIPDRKITLDDITPKNIDPSHINAKELWKKASIKILTLVRMNKLKNFINNVYYGIDVEDSECEDAFEEEATWVSFTYSSLVF